MAVSDWNTNPDLNTSIDAVSIAENCPAGNLNDMGRRIMAAVRTWYNAAPTSASVAAAISAAIATATAGMWTSSNDGSGSGLDADLWRGNTPAQFFTAYFLSGANANGYWRKIPDGASGYIIEQWGDRASGAAGFSTGYDFPIPFPSNCESIQATPVSLAGVATTIAAVPISATQFMLGSEGASRTCYWRAVGR